MRWENYLTKVKNEPFHDFFHDATIKYATLAIELANLHIIENSDFSSYLLDATIGYHFYKLDIIDNNSELNLDDVNSDDTRVKRRIWMYSLSVNMDY